MGDGGIVDQGNKINAGVFWKDLRIEYSSGDPVYVGRVYEYATATSTAIWEIWKLTWSGGNCTRMEGPLVGAWDNRATLGWT